LKPVKPLKPSSTPPGRKQLTHDRIVEVAARAIRRSGYDGTGVADIMQEAGLTHGGFYAHFASRDVLIAEAIERAGRDSGERVDRSTALRRQRGASPLRALVETYLSDSHLTSAESGCVVAALASESPRQAAPVRAAAARRVKALIDRVSAALPPDAPAGQAGVIAATLVGSLQLARALDDARQGRALLKAARDTLLAQHEPGTKEGD
jgi:AcrR family transcriptional regulator